MRLLGFLKQKPIHTCDPVDGQDGHQLDAATAQVIARLIGTPSGRTRLLQSAILAKWGNSCVGCEARTFRDLKRIVQAIDGQEPDWLGPQEGQRIEAWRMVDRCRAILGERHGV